MNKRRWRAANLSISEHFYSLENTVSQVLSHSVRPRACSPGVVNCSPFPHSKGVRGAPQGRRKFAYANS